MQGRIVKGIAGFYYVYIDGIGVVECKAKGVFRKDGIKPLVGDFACVELLDSTGQMPAGNIESILPRTNSLIRPEVANVDQALIIFALKKPEPNFVTLDKMILQYKYQSVDVLICFNKEDLTGNDYADEIAKAYSGSGCRVFTVSALLNSGIDEVKEALMNKLTVVAGPSGVGKSSIINALLDRNVSTTGAISDKLKRGKHTTRHSEIFSVCDNTFIMDTPGFGSFELFDIKKEELEDYYEEFNLTEACRFMPCSHTHEPDCVVKEQVELGRIHKLRYNNYVEIYNELKQVRRY